MLMTFERFTRTRAQSSPHAGHVLLGVLVAGHGRVPGALRIADIDVDEVRTRV
jgi:hypothetical protein